MQVVQIGMKDALKCSMRRKIDKRWCRLGILAGFVALGPEIIAAPPSKAANAREPLRLEAQASDPWGAPRGLKVQKKGGYLTAGVLRPVKLRAVGNSADAGPDGVAPTYRGFLEYIAAEKAAAEAAEQAESAAADEAEEAAAHMESATAQDNSVEPEVGESAAAAAAQRQPMVEREPGIFPRPQRSEQLERRVYLYFPIEGDAGGQVLLELPGNYDARFTPPRQTAPLRSTATLQEGVQE